LAKKLLKLKEAIDQIKDFLSKSETKVDVDKDKLFQQIENIIEENHQEKLKYRKLINKNKKEKYDVKDKQIWKRTSLEEKLDMNSAEDRRILSNHLSTLMIKGNELESKQSDLESNCEIII